MHVCVYAVCSDRDYDYCPLLEWLALSMRTDPETTPMVMMMRMIKGWRHFVLVCVMIGCVSGCRGCYLTTRADSYVEPLLRGVRVSLSVVYLLFATVQEHLYQR